MKAESQPVYDVLPQENNLVEKYHPKFLACGGDHLVYEIPEHPDVVVKASTFRIKDILVDNAEHGVPLDSLSDGMREFVGTELKEKDEQSRNLRNYFGNEHTLAERRFLMKVPVTGEIVADIFKDDWKGRVPPEDSLNMNEAWSSVTVQQRAEAINDPKHLSLNFEGFLEEDKYDDTAIQHILTLSENNPALRDSLKEFVSKAVSYANETGNILAMAGKDNIIFYKDPENGEKWNYLLVDALSIHNEPVFKVAQEISLKIINGEKITPHEQTLLMKALNFTRTINNIASALGMSEHLGLQTEL
ncbi:MAG: hypothetical protein V4524_01690 [Patescibacteria group bacterium]